MEYHGYMEDCIHLKACRRIQKIGRKQGECFSRHCDEDCTAYQSKQKNTGLITVDKAIRYARNGVNSIRGGYSAYDVYASIDFDGETMSLGDVLERLTK